MDAHGRRTGANALVRKGVCSEPGVAAGRVAFDCAEEVSKVGAEFDGGAERADRRGPTQ